jgi:sugar-specific transcriptional regulator TrmB
MNERFIEQFAKFGLKPQETLVYLACLSIGEATVGELAKKASIQRTFVYDVAEDLIRKGLFSKIVADGIRRFSAISIERFKKIQLSKIGEFEEILPELRALQSAGNEPKVQFFRGKEGVFAALYDTLSLPRGSEIVGYATMTGLYSDEMEKSLEYLNLRIKKGITLRELAPDTEETREITEKNEEHLRQTRLLPKEKFPFMNEINIYGDKIAIMSVQGEYLAVIIESESIAKTQRMIFELAWRGAKDFQK